MDNAVTIEIWVLLVWGGAMGFIGYGLGLKDGAKRAAKHTDASKKGGEK